MKGLVRTRANTRELVRSHEIVHERARTRTISRQSYGPVSMSVLLSYTSFQTVLITSQLIIVILSVKSLVTLSLPSGDLAEIEPGTSGFQVRK